MGARTPSLAALKPHFASSPSPPLPSRPLLGLVAGQRTEDVGAVHPGHLRVSVRRGGLAGALDATAPANPVSVFFVLCFVLLVHCRTELHSVHTHAASPPKVFRKPKFLRGERQVVSYCAWYAGAVWLPQSTRVDLDALPPCALMSVCSRLLTVRLVSCVIFGCSCASTGRRVRLVGVVWTGLKWAIPSVLASVLLDSALWGR